MSLPSFYSGETGPTRNQLLHFIPLKRDPRCNLGSKYTHYVLGCQTSTIGLVLVKSVEKL